MDEFEIEALFQIELDKVFNETSKDFDRAERDEEMARMREHVFTEMDKNKDKMISLEEFINETKQKDFNENEEWKVGFKEFVEFVVDNSSSKIDTIAIWESGVTASIIKV